MPQGFGSGLFLTLAGLETSSWSSRERWVRSRYLVVQGVVKFQDSKVTPLNWNFGTRFWNFGIGLDRRLRRENNAGTATRPIPKNWNKFQNEKPNWNCG